MKGIAGQKNRKEGAKKRLEAQLKQGNKPEKIDGKTTKRLIPLTDADKTRINREIEALSKTKKKIDI